MSDQLPAAAAVALAIEERNQILRDMDIEAAKAFIAKHGGVVTQRKIDWVRVLHLARFECAKGLPDEGWRESQMWLAMNDARSVMMLRPTSPYVEAALNLIFPKQLTDDYIRQMEGKTATPEASR